MKFIIALLFFVSVSALVGQAPPTNVAAATPASLLFAQTVSGTAAPQTVALALAMNTTGTTFAAATSASWLTVTPSSGNVPGSLTASVNPTGLTAGSNSGTITIALSGTNMGQLIVPVTYVLTTSPALVTSMDMVALGAGFGMMSGMPGGPGGMPGDPGMPGGNPGGGTGQMALSATVQVASTVGASPFTATIANTCANAFTIAPSSGTTPATITATGDMTVLASGTNCSGSLTVSSPGLPTVTLPVTTVLPINGGGAPPTGGMSATPTVTQIVNAASYVEGAVAPGEIVTVFGTNLGPTTLTSGMFANGALSTTLGTMQVKFGDSTAPILYARSDQMSVVVPFDAGSGLVNMQILSSGQTVSTTQVPVVSAVPGIFTTASSGSGQAAILNQDGTINSVTSAAAHGSVVSIYLTGAGALTPPGGTGALASTVQLQKIVDPVTVTISGQPAIVVFAGAAPGSLLGLYQINAVVPTSAAVGNAAIQVSVGAATSQMGVTLNVK